MQLEKLVGMINENASQTEDDLAQQVIEFCEITLNRYIEELSPVQDRSNATLGSGPSPLRSGELRVLRNYNHYASGQLRPTTIPVILKIGTAHKGALELSRKFRDQLINDIEEHFELFRERDRSGYIMFETDHHDIVVTSEYASGFASVQVFLRAH